ncbi:MAG: hypothetical protein SF123_14080 [Chloroflexota bacterium]|nr:hypothetical protein [Chloroflexota bacterium]
MAVFAQPQSELVAADIDIVETQDIYGQTVQTVEGRLVNEGTSAYATISLTAQAYDRGDELVGEGFGVLVNACGAGLPFDFVQQPGESRPFAIPLELFEADAVVDRVEVSATGEAVAANGADAAPLAEGIEQVSSQEVVAVEWESATTLRYAIGCERDLFIDWRWQRYDLTTGRNVSIEHPNASDVTDDLRERLLLEDPLIFANSRLRFAPISGERLVYQDRINDVWTAAREGNFQRRLQTLLNSYTLQGYLWLPEDRFVAYYYGGYGDPVRYFVADAEGRLYGQGPLSNRASVTIPGVTSDGLRAIISGTFDDVTGYYIDIRAQGFFELLFEAELPGNNYPPPVPLLNETGDRVTQIYLIRPVDGEPRLQCFVRPEDGENTLIDLTSLPLNIAIDERAWTFLSPDERIIALSANGINGGLWLIDRDSVGNC